MRKIMIVGLGWEQLPLLDKAKEMGLKTVVTTWWRKDRIAADSVYEVDSRNLTRIEEIFLEEKPDAIIADECDYSMYATAYLTDKYSLPGPGLKALTATNNKFLQRDLAGKAGILQPEFRLCWNCDMALETAKDIGYPVIIKPTDNRGTIGISTANNPQELKDAWYLAVANSHSRMCVVEKFIVGDTITCEGFCDSEKFNFLAVSTKESYPQTPNVAKVLYYPGKIEDKHFIEYLEVQSNKIVQAMEIRYGFVHIEFLIEKNTNRPFFVEVANRGGGVHISNKILPEITGIDLVRNLIDMSLGKEVVLSWHRGYKSKVLMYFLNPIGSNTPDKIKEKYKNTMLALFTKPSKETNNVIKQGAAGRAGVAIIKGQNFSDIINIGKTIEAEIGFTSEEYYWGWKK